MKERKDGPDLLFERREIRLCRLVGLGCLLVSVVVPFVLPATSSPVPIAGMISIGVLIGALFLLLTPAIQLRVRADEVTRRYTWWLPIVGSFGTRGRSVQRDEVGKVFVERYKTGSGGAGGSDQTKWGPCLWGESKIELWRFESKERAVAAGERLAEALQKSLSSR